MEKILEIYVGSIRIIYLILSSVITNYKLKISYYLLKNIGKYLSFEKTAFSNGDLFLIETKKKGVLISMIKETKVKLVIEILQKTLLK